MVRRGGMKLSIVVGPKPNPLAPKPQQAQQQPGGKLRRTLSEEMTPRTRARKHALERSLSSPVIGRAEKFRGFHRTLRQAWEEDPGLDAHAKAEIERDYLKWKAESLVAHSRPLSLEKIQETEDEGPRSRRVLAVNDHEGPEASRGLCSLCCTLTSLLRVLSGSRRTGLPC